MAGQYALHEVSRIDTSEIEQLLQSGRLSSSHDTLEAFLEKTRFRELESLMLRLYIGMDIYMVAKTFAFGLGITGEQFTSRFGSIDEIAPRLQTVDSTTSFLHEMIEQCIRWRMEAASEGGREIVRRAKQCIDSRYADSELSLSAVADAVGFSAPYLSAVFKREMHMNFSDYLTSVRIRRAKELLCCTSKLVSEIAFEVGFRDYRYFSQVFKKHTGLTPRAFQSSSNTNLQ